MVTEDKYDLNYIRLCQKYQDVFFFFFFENQYQDVLVQLQCTGPKKKKCFLKFEYMKINKIYKS